MSAPIAGSSVHAGGPRSFTGHPLKGGKLVRLVYLDEAGTSKVSEEPYLVVAGVIIDPDKHWRELDTYFRDLARELFPEEDPYRFVFHAMDVFHGSRAFDRRKWSRPERMKIMRRLAQVPSLFELTVTIGSVHRRLSRAAYLKENPKMPEKTIRTCDYSYAFLQAIQCVEYWMEKNRPDEMTMLISEDAPEIKAALHNLHEGYINPDTPEDAFRAPHVMDSIQFAKKDRSLLLQIADHCAFIVKRHIMGKTDVTELFKMIEPRLSLKYRAVEGFIFSVNASDVEPV